MIREFFKNQWSNEDSAFWYLVATATFAVPVLVVLLSIMGVR